MEEITKLVHMQRAWFQKDRTKDWHFRMEALRRFEQAFNKWENVLSLALKRDLNKASTESYMTEIGLVKSELRYFKQNLGSLTRKQYVPTPVSQFPSCSYTMFEPYGVVLILAPWNYPVLLCLQPLIAAIAAGNCCVIKPSEYAPSVSDVISHMIAEAFPSHFVAVVEGDKEVSQTLLEQRFDYIFFTGSPNVGRAVMRQASENLTPVTLELGGKSPCIIDRSADLKLAAKRLVFGKYLNAGQTCVAPDYLMVESSVMKEVSGYICAWVRHMFGDNPLTNPDYPKIVSKKHFDRLNALLEGQNILIGGEHNPDTLQIAPTVVTQVSREDALMKEEIFGPILPILTYQSMDELETYLKAQEKPLALYLFSHDKKMQQRILTHISFGGGCINDTIVHIASAQLPFGGVGNSGMGSYHGRYGFETFSHQKSILKKGDWLDLPLRYQPYELWKDVAIRKFLK